ncbi:hypothetical protein [Hymenobacter sp. UYCo722]|uniref:hypothetical protein n=1 Tax=Hymenobacter sp. UYCo722 TaxID=3156335 RepID=UPI0033985E2D
MKFLPSLFSAALLGAAVLATAPAAHAQANININVGTPAWGPPVPQGTQFYYIPEIDGYYDLNAQQYIVNRNGQWIPVGVIDGRDPRSFHPVVLDYRGREPWVYVGAHRDRYPRRVVVVRPGRGLPPGQAKKMYREGYREGRYDRDDRDDDRGHGKGHGKGHGRGHDRDDD